MSYEYVLEAENLTKHYEVAETEIKALDGVSLKVRRGEYLSIMGPSGSGKTTLFNLVGGLDRATQGRIYIDAVDITQLDAFELAWLRCRKVGYVFQTFNLLPVLTALENATLPTIFAGLSQREGLEKARVLLQQIGLGDRLDHKPRELSGGEQQRVAIARALVNDPQVVLADEPTGNLDLHTGKQIIALLRMLNRERNVTIITATHDLKMIGVSDRVVYLRDGRLEREETGAEIQLKRIAEPRVSRSQGLLNGT